MIRRLSPKKLVLFSLLVIVAVFALNILAMYLERNLALFLDQRADSYRNSGLNDDADAYDNDAGDIYYAKLPAFGTTYNESTMSCVVDSNGMVGSNLTLDVAYDKAASEGGKAIPYISYYGSIQRTQLIL